MTGVLVEPEEYGRTEHRLLPQGIAVHAADVVREESNKCRDFSALYLLCCERI